MKHTILLITLLICAGMSKAQYVGINKPNPTEALDVNGNINLSGSIKINGSTGNEGQVLASNGMGGMWWLPASKPAFTRMKVFAYNLYAIERTFTVPDGVTAIRFEIWSGGGRAYQQDLTKIYFSGGGGGYSTGIIPVTPGSQIKLRTPAGQESDYSKDSAFIKIDASNRLVLRNGDREFPGNVQVSVGIFSESTASMFGETGKPSVRTRLALVDNIAYDDRLQMANGGDAPSGGKGAFGGMISKRTDNNAVLQIVSGYAAQSPGGGGAFAIDQGGNISAGNAGVGRIIFYY